MKEWSSGGVVNMVDVTASFLGVAGAGDESLMKSQMSMSSISSLTLISKISSITFVMVEGFSTSENKGRGCDMLMCSRPFSG